MGFTAFQYHIHGSTAIVDRPTGSLGGYVRDVIRNNRGTTIKQVGGEDGGINHYYNGFFLSFTNTIPFPIEIQYLEAYAIYVTFKATEGTWIAWMRVYDGEKELAWFPYETTNKYPGKGATLDSAESFIRPPILEQLPRTKPNDFGISAFIPVGFPNQKLGEVCLMSAELHVGRP
jgi:hypothetical protein